MVKRKDTQKIRIPAGHTMPPESNWVLYDPIKKYCLDHFDSEATLIEFWTKCWKPPKKWKTVVAKRCIGIRYDGKKKPKVKQIYFYGFWLSNKEKEDEQKS